MKSLHVSDLFIAETWNGWRWWMASLLIWRLTVRIFLLFLDILLVILLLLSNLVRIRFGFLLIIVIGEILLLMMSRLSLILLLLGHILLLINWLLLHWDLVLMNLVGIYVIIHLNAFILIMLCLKLLLMQWSLNSVFNVCYFLLRWLRCTSDVSLWWLMSVYLY